MFVHLYFCVCVFFPSVLWYCWLGLLTCNPYNLYCVGGDVKPCSVNHLYTALVPSMYDDLAFIVKCSEAILSWSTANALLLNPNNREAVMLRSRQQLDRFDSSWAGIDVARVSFCSRRLIQVTWCHAKCNFVVRHTRHLTLFGTVSATLRRCATSDHSWLSKQPRLLQIQSLELGSTTVTVWQRWRTLIDYSTFRTIWHVSQCQRVALTCGMSCIGYPSDTVSSSSWLLLPLRQNSLSSQRTSTTFLYWNTSQNTAIIFSWSSTPTVHFYVTWFTLIDAPYCSLTLNPHLVSASLNLMSKLNSTP